MAMSARASNIGGTLIAEKRNGSRRFHAHDSLGSTIALVNDAGSTTDTYSYWPYGEIRTSTGSTSSTPFKFCGAWGYYDDGNQLYVRARYLREKLGRWLTKDPMWPGENAYAYVNCSPIQLSDIFGLGPCDGPGRSCCICYPKDLPPSELLRCKNCASAANFGSIDAFCQALNNWDAGEPNTNGTVAALCCKLNFSSCTGEAKKRCKDVPADERDKCVHCVTACCLAKKCGKTFALWCGWCKERQDLLDCKDSGIFDRDDMIANTWGIEHSHLASCGKACEKYGAK